MSKEEVSANVLNVCANCKHWDLYESEEKAKKSGYELAKGQCHRYPPNVISFDQTEKRFSDGIALKDAIVPLLLNLPMMDHPVSWGGDWCGEFSPLESEYIRIQGWDDDDK